METLILESKMIVTYEQISWWMACSNSLLFRMALTLPLLLLAQKGEVTSTFDSQTSDEIPEIVVEVIDGLSNTETTKVLSPEGKGCIKPKDDICEENFSIKKVHKLKTKFKMDCFYKTEDY